MTQAPIRIGVIQFPGSNCERETALALKRAGCEPVDFLWSEPKEVLDTLDGFVIVGGFSYEDRVRSGLIASKDPVVQALARQAGLGKPVLGICNGAQILVESGLVPGLPNQEVAIALTQNRRMRGEELLGVGFYNNWVYMKAGGEHADSAFSTALLTQNPIHIPVAHAEGRFLLSDDLYRALQKTRAVFYYYCNAVGEALPEFPVNPNGSSHNLAAIGNAAGNVLAMMPHPERTKAGDAIFTALRRYIEQRRAGVAFETIALDYAAPKFNFAAYPVTSDSSIGLDYWVGLKIQDNEAISLQNTLNELGIQVSLRKCVHWQIGLPQNTDSKTLDSRLMNSDILFNRQKEQLCDPQRQHKSLPADKAIRTYIIRAHEDERAIEKMQQLKHFVPDLHLIRETAWQVVYAKADESAVTGLLERTALLGNPLAHEGFIL